MESCLAPGTEALPGLEGADLRPGPSPGIGPGPDLGVLPPSIPNLSWFGSVEFEPVSLVPISTVCS